MRTVHTAAELVEAVGEARAAGMRVALVPTMGALHEGHISLVRLARKHADFVIVSIFVNPLQFGAGEDFDKYPRTLEADVAALASQPAEARADLVFAPSVEAVYPGGNRHITQHAGPVGETFEGASRQGHFDGMLTVVDRLFSLAAPDVAVFGAKDAQQVFLVRQLAARAHPSLEIIEAPTVRESSGLARGLAMSSRNRYLSAADQQAATVLHRALEVAADRAAAGVSPQQALAAAREMLAQEPAVRLDYLAAVDADTFESLESSNSETLEDRAGEAILLIAANVAGTRLIDNLRTRFSGAKA